MSDLDDLVAAMVKGDSAETVPLDVVTAMAQAAREDGWEHRSNEWWSDMPDPDNPHVQQLQAEFGNGLTIWGRTGTDAWTTVVGMFHHCGWTPPEDTDG